MFVDHAHNPQRLHSASSGHSAEDGFQTVWTHIQQPRPRRADGSPGGPGGSPQPGPSTYASSTESIAGSPSSGAVPGPLSASSSEASMAPPAQPEGAKGKGKGPSAALTASLNRKTRRGRRGPKRCRRCGRFLKKESWIRSITRTVSKSLTSAPWGRRRECRSCGRIFRRGYRGRNLSRGRSSSRGRSMSRRRSRSRPRSRSRSRSMRRKRSRSRSSRRSTRRRRRRRSIDDQKFFVC